MYGGFFLCGRSAREQYAGRYFFRGERVEWSVREQGPRAVIEVWRKDDGEGLYKAYLAGPGGRIPLGALMPEGGRLFLRRVLSIDSLRRQGVWPVRQVGEELACSFHSRPEPLVWEDEVLRRCAARLPRHTVRREGENFFLSFPFDPCEPFPLVPLFCFGRVEGGRLIFSFHPGGVPYIFQREGKDREEVEAQRGEQHGKPDHRGAPRSGGSAGI